MNEFLTPQTVFFVTSAIVVLVVLLCVVYRKRRSSFFLNKKRVYQTFYEHAPVATVLVDHEAKILDVNLAARRLLELDSLERGSVAFSSLILPEDAATFEKAVKNALYHNQSDDFDLTLLTKASAQIIVRVKSEKLNIEGKCVLLMILQDINELKVAERKMAYLAYHDYLTGLPNRRNFEEQLRQKLQEMIGTK
jgi:PAS domain S-box-containing protein